MEFCSWTERATKPRGVALRLRRGFKYEDI